MHAEKSFKRDYLLLCAQAALFSFSVAAQAALIPSIAATFSKTALFMGRLTWMYMLPYGLCALLWGPLTHRVKTKDLLTGTLLLFSLASLLAGSAQNATMVFVAVFFIGVFGSSVIPLSLIIIGKYVQQQKGRYVGTLFAGTYISSLCGVLLSSVLSWRFIYLLPGIAGIILFVLCGMLLPAFDLRKESYRLSYHTTITKKPVRNLMGMIFLSSYAFHTLQQWLGVYIKDHYGATQFFISMILTLSSIAALLMQLYGGVLADKKGRVRMFILGSFVMLFSIAALLVTRALPAYYLILILPLWGGGWALSHVGISSCLTSLSDTYLRDASSLNSSIRFVSGGLGAYVGGRVIGGFGFPAHFFMVSFLLLGIMFMSRRMLRAHDAV